MRGTSHAVSGAAAWACLTTTSAVAIGGFDTHGIAVFGMGALMCAGAAMVPDIDHPDGSIAHSLPSVTAGNTTLIPGPTKGLAYVVAFISGGHRHGTHSLIGIAVMGALTWLADRVRVPIVGLDTELPLVSALIAVLLLAFALKALGITKSGLGRGKKNSLTRTVNDVLRSWVGPWAVSLTAVAAWTYFMGPEAWSWLWVAMTVGCVTHVLGDGLTIQGVPWLWPLNPAPPKAVQTFVAPVWTKNGYFRIPVLGTTKDASDAHWWDRESLFTSALTVYFCYLVLFEVLSTQLQSNVLI